MKTFEIEIIETLSTIVKVKADSIDEAVVKVKEKYRNEEIILTADDYVDTEFKPFNYEFIESNYPVRD